jgi:arylsulfatase A-like enzyme
MLNRRDFLGLTAAVGAAATLGRLAPTVQAAPAALRPNIIFIISDDLGNFDLGVNGGPIPTPTLNRMAAEGMKFTDAYSGCAVCAPARSVLMTGQHTGHTTVRTNPGGVPLKAEDVTVAQALKAAGYTCGGYGKWGVGDVGTPGVPEKHGFDDFFGYYHQVHAHDYYTDHLFRNGNKVPLEGNAGGGKKTYSHYVIFEEMKKFLRANKDKPFFCYAPWTPPHGSFVIPEADPAVALFQGKPWPAPVKNYAAMSAMVDRCTGEILGLVKELGLDDRTIVFFCGDNGPPGRNEGTLNGAGPLRGQKGSLYEGGIRVPMLVRWPGRIKPGSVSNLPWYFADIFPTFAELAGAETPANLDGVSIVPTLLGEEAAGHKQAEREYLYWEWSGQTAVRMGRWKGVQPKGKTAVELYDLSKDPGEKNDVAAANPDVAAKIEAIMKAAHTEPDSQNGPVRKGKPAKKK